MSRISKSKTKRQIVIFAILVIALVAMSIGMFKTELNSEIEAYSENMSNELISLKKTVEEQDVKWTAASEAYDNVLQAKADYMRYIYEKDKGFNYYQLRKYRDQISVDNIIVIDADGNILAKAYDTEADFRTNRFNMLKACIKKKADYMPFSVSYPSGNEYIYYGAAIDSEKMFVIEQNIKEYEGIVADFSSWKNVLSNVYVGSNGCVMAVSDHDYNIYYHSDSQYIHQDALAYGLKSEDLTDGNIEMMQFAGNHYLVGVVHADNAYLLCMIPRAEVYRRAAGICGCVMLAFAIVLFLMGAYATILRTTKTDEEDKVYFVGKNKNYCYNTTILRKITAITLVGIVGIYAAYVYSQMLFSISQSSMVNELRLDAVSLSVKEKSNLKNDEVGFYDDTMRERISMVGYALQVQDNNITNSDAKALAKVLNLDSLLIYNNKGEVIVCNDNSIGFKLSTNPNDQSYEFRELLTNNLLVVQEPQKNDQGVLMQYAGVSLYDEEKGIVGIAELGMKVSERNRIMAGGELDNILESMVFDINSMVFAVNKYDMKFTYFPDDKFIGKDSTLYGLDADENYYNFSGYIDINDQRCFANVAEVDDNFIFVATPVQTVSGIYMRKALSGTIVAGILLFIVCHLLCIYKKDDKEEFRQTFIDYQSAADRWRNSELKWHQMTPEQKLFMLFEDIVNLITIAVSAYVLFGARFNGKYSIIAYILDGKWERGINIFSITASLIACCVAAVVHLIIKKLLTILSDTLTARGTTICRMLRSASKYVIIIIVVFYIMSLSGANPTTILASAGFLSAVIAFGANSIMADILAGFLLVFEGEFRVGDIVTIDGWRGVVLDIGIRTTKIEDDYNNIKIIANSNISGIINMTKKNSLTEILMGIEYGESLERVEEVLKKELPPLYQKVPHLNGAPYYTGVSEFADSAVVIRILAECGEAYRPQVIRDINRELKLIFDRNNINIPFPQVTISQLNDKKSNE